jgi:hypothetical protein
MMSYPQVLRNNNLGDEYVTFTVPNSRIAKKVHRDQKRTESLRVQVAAKALKSKYREVLLLFDKYYLEASVHAGNSELKINLFTSLTKQDFIDAGIAWKPFCNKSSTIFI